MRAYLFAVVLLVVPSLATAEPKETEPRLKPNKSQALIRELPKFSDEPEGIGLGFGVGEPMDLAVAYRPNKTPYPCGHDRVEHQRIDTSPSRRLSPHFRHHPTP